MIHPPQEFFSSLSINLPADLAPSQMLLSSHNLYTHFFICKNIANTGTGSTWTSTHLLTTLYSDPSILLFTREQRHILAGGRCGWGIWKHLYEDTLHMTETKPIPTLWCQPLPSYIAGDLRNVLAANFEKVSINYMEVNIRLLLIRLQKKWGLMAWKKK